MEISPPYPVGPTDSTESPLTTEDRVAQAHASRQGIPYETREPWLERRPERLRDRADLIRGGQMPGGEAAYAVAALSDRMENTRGDEDRRLH